MAIDTGKIYCKNETVAAFETEGYAEDMAEEQRKCQALMASHTPKQLAKRITTICDDQVAAAIATRVRCGEAITRKQFFVLARAVVNLDYDPRDA